MKPADYVAVRRITNLAGNVLAAVGESCDRVPPDALSWLLDGGDIKLATLSDTVREADARRTKSKPFLLTPVEGKE